MSSSNPLTYDRDLHAILQAAASLSGSYRRLTLLPETLLLAMLQDQTIRSRWAGSAAEAEARLEHAVYTLPAEADAGGAWSARSRRAIQTAWDRAYARKLGRVSRGDLLSGLAGASGLAAELVRAGGVDPATLDAEDPALPEGDLSDAPAGAAPGSALRLVIDDDPQTIMVVVVEILREQLGVAQPRALVAMLRTHFRGGEVVAVLPEAEAREAIARCRSVARSRELGLRFRLVR